MNRLRIVIMSALLLLLSGSAPGQEELVPPTYWFKSRQCLFLELRAKVKAAPPLEDPSPDLHYATMADTKPEKINLPAYSAEPANPGHNMRGTLQRDFDDVLGRKFMGPLAQSYIKDAWGYDSDKTIDVYSGHAPIDPAMKGKVILTRVFFEYEHELRSDRGDLLKAWGRLYVRTESRDFKGRMIYQGSYLWDQPNPVRPLLDQARARYYDSLKSDRGEDIPPEKRHEIMSTDESLPLALTEFYVVHGDGEAKGLFRLYNLNGQSELPHELKPGQPPKTPLDPHVDEKQPVRRKVAVGNAWADTSDPSKRYASYWEFAWACAVHRMGLTTQNQTTIEAEARGAAVRLFTRNYKFPSVQSQPSGDTILSTDGTQFLHLNEKRILDALPETKSKATEFYPYYKN